MSIPLLLWRYSNLERRGEDITPPGYFAGEVGDTNQVTVEVTFSEGVTAVGNDYMSGVTIQVNGSDATIESGSRQSDGKTIFYAIASSDAVDINDVVTFEYDSATGAITDLTGNALGDIAAQTVKNYVGSHYWYFTEECSAHI